MALDENINTLEKAKFVEDGNGDTAVRTLTEIVGSLVGSFAPSGLQNGGQDTTMNVSSTTWTKIERSASTTPTGRGKLSPLNSLKITNIGVIEVTTTINDDPNGNSQAYEIGDRIAINNSQFLDITDKKPDDTPIDVWVRAKSGTGKIFFREIG